MKRNLATVIFVALLGVLVSSLSYAQQPTKKRPKQTADAPPGPAAAETAAIRAGAKAFVAAFNKGDAKAIAALWTPNGEYMDATGRRFNGRAEIEKDYAEFFADNPDTKIRITIDSVRLLSSDAAIEDGHAVTSPTVAAGAAGSSRYTVTHVKVGGKWLMASVRDAPVEISATARSAADLNWLVGTWVAEERGVKTKTVVRWVVEGRFLERTYTTTQIDGTTSSGVQLIGWNPLAGHVQSWNFSPDGGHAVGVWIPVPGGWMGQMSGVMGDGAPTASINQLRRLDDNAYIWQSVHRMLGSTLLPDTGEVVWKRLPATH